MTNSNSIDLPFSNAADKNKHPITEALKTIITKQDRNLFEIGSGTGQHAVHFASYFPSLKWQTSDLEENHSTIKAYIARANLNNILSPIYYEAGKSKLPTQKYDLVFTANTFHIMAWKQVKTLIKNIANIMNEGAQIIIYGPFNFNGDYTSESNANFDIWLKEKNSQYGIRNFEDIESNFKKSDIHFSQKIQMPANNQILVFTKITKQK